MQRISRLILKRANLAMNNPPSDLLYVSTRASIPEIFNPRNLSAGNAPLDSTLEKCRSVRMFGEHSDIFADIFKQDMNNPADPSRKSGSLARITSDHYDTSTIPSSEP